MVDWSNPTRPSAREGTAAHRPDPAASGPDRHPAPSAERPPGPDPAAIARAVQAAAARYANLEPIWPLVDRLLNLVEQFPELQALNRELVLTRDLRRDRAQRTELERRLLPRLVEARVNLDPAVGPVVVDLTYDELLGISVLGPYWRDEQVADIFVDAWNRIAVEHSGLLWPTPLRFRDHEHALRVARNLAEKVSGRALTPENMLVAAELPGARLQFTYGRVARSGLTVVIRKHRPLLSIERLLETGALSAEMRDFLADAVVARANVLVSGGTGTGKTTIVNVLSRFIPDTERVITIEDSFELQLTNRFVVPLQTKEAASADDRIRVSQADLMRAALRMRPDRIIVGEVRDPAGAAVMLEAASTGHDGTMGTIHADDPSRALNFRLGSWLRTALGASPEVAAAEVANAVDVVVQVNRDHLGRRYISRIDEVDLSGVTGDLIRTEELFRARPAPDQGIVFDRVGRLRPDTDLGRKLAAVGRLDRWS